MAPTRARPAACKVAEAKLQGYELATALLISDRNAAPLGPLCQELRAADGWHSSRLAAPDAQQQQQQQWRLDAPAAPLGFSAGLPLGKPVVHLIGREADSVVHSRAGAQAGHRLVVRADDRLVSVATPHRRSTGNFPRLPGGPACGQRVARVARQRAGEPPPGQEVHPPGGLSGA